MYCDRCGASNRSEARFCRSCGAKLARAEGDGDNGARNGAVAEARREAGSSVPPDVNDALIDAFEVHELIGRGGMGSVYRATERSLERPVAIKVLPTEVSENPVRVRRFLREARLAARLRHPNIVSIHAIGEKNGLHYFTMDLIEGDSLVAHVARSHATGLHNPVRARALVASVVNAVSFAHGEGVIHRDLKPSNIMVDRDDNPIVLDFGLATAKETSNLTVDGAVFGTPRYMSPEQVKGEESAPAGDVYALGLIYYFVMTGDDLVRGKSTGEIAAQHLEADFRPRVERDSRVPYPDAQLILGMVAREPGRRPGLAQVVADLRQISVAPGQLDDTLSLAESRGFEASARNAPRARARDRMKRLIDQLDRNRHDDEGS
jgi:serine/threonine-protein kinase